MSDRELQNAVHTIVAENSVPSTEALPFEARPDHALADKQSQTALGRFPLAWRTSRAAVFATEEADYARTHK